MHFWTFIIILRNIIYLRCWSGVTCLWPAARNCIYFKLLTFRKMWRISWTFHFHTHLKFNAMEYNKLTDRGENAIASSPSIFVGPEVCPLGFCWDGTSPKFYQNTWKIQILLSVARCHPCHSCHSGLAIDTAFIFYP